MPAEYRGPKRICPAESNAHARHWTDGAGFSVTVSPSVPMSEGGAARIAAGVSPRLLLLIYACSGLTSLAFEVLWARMLTLQFGVSAFGVVITVAAFMAGLGVGSLAGLYGLARLARPLRLFALLEAGIAAFALLLPMLLQSLEAWVGALAPGIGIGSWHLLQGAVSLGCLMLPATAMGAGFPLVLRAATGSGVSLARVYGFNTCGAAIGALLPLALLPLWGWSSAVVVVATLGALVAAAAWWLDGRTTAATGPVPDAQTNPTPDPQPHPQPHPLRAARPTFKQLPTWIAYGGIGAAALMLEIGWTRLFGMVLLRTEYVLAVILAVYLIGVGGGSLIAHTLRGPRWLAVLPPLAAASGLVSLAALPWLSRWAEAADYSSLMTALLWQGGAIALLTLPLTLALGAWLPLLARRLDGEVHGAWLYGVNSIGAALGAVIGGFVLVPWIGTPATVAVASLALYVCGMVWVERRSLWLTAIPLAAAAIPLAAFPPVARLLPHAHAGGQDLFRYEDAMALTHVIERRDGQRLLLSDLQRMDASTDPAAVALQMNQARLPLLLHPAPHRVLFLGLGTGISLAGSAPYPDLQRTAVELSRGAIVAARRWFAPLSEPVLARTRVVHDDVRRFLRVDTSSYDVIIGDVFHPDLVGRSALLSVQQFRRARERLAEGGLFVQWLALNQFDLDALQTVLRSFHEVYPRAVLFLDGFRLAMVGPRDALAGTEDLLTRVDALPGTARAARTGGEGVWSWLGRFWGPIDVPAGATQQEWWPRIEYSLPRVRYRRETALLPLLQWLDAHRAREAEIARMFAVPAARREALERAYVATELGLGSWLADLAGDDGEAARLLRYAYEANPHDRWIGLGLADRMMATIERASAAGLDRRRALLAILKVRPDHPEALRALWRLEEAAGDADRAATYRRRLEAVSPLDREVRAARG